MSDSEGKNRDSTVAISFRGSRAIGRKHQALLDFRGRDRWLIHGNQFIDVTFFARTLLQGGSMTRRFLIFSFAASLLALGGLNAQAGTLPTTLDTLLPAGSSAVVGDLTFSNFTYTTATPPPTAAGVTVNPFSLSGPPVETGISFSGGFFAAPGATADYSITYQVTSQHPDHRRLPGGHGWKSRHRVRRCRRDHSDPRRYADRVPQRVCPGQLR